MARMLKPEDSSDHMNWEAPEANGYEFHSEYVIDTLKQMLTKFREGRTEAEPEEQRFDSIS